MAYSDEHSKRWKTAIVLLISIFSIAIIDSKFLTWLFLGVVYMLSIKESIKLFKIEESGTLFIISSAIWLFGYFYPNPLELIFLALMLIASIVAYNRSINIKVTLPILYPTVGVLFFWMLYLSYGMKSLLWLLVIVALTDVGAYYVGRKFGKRGFSITSPNKTFEGVVGGLLFGTVGGTFLIVGTYNVLFWAVVVSFITSLASIFGDLFESYLKREVGVKDSGDILPGHGGVLDRVDGYLFASVALYTFLHLIIANHN
jgi:phosphatidate cytidylyltransferase